MLTVDNIKEALPAHLKNSASQNLADHVNQIAQDPEVAEHVRNNFISYTAVLTQGKFQVEEYINAVAYVSYKIMGYTNKESYARTFPQRYAALAARGAS